VARLTTLEAVTDGLSSVRDRLTTVETKAAQPPAVLPQGPTDAEIEILVRDRLEPLTKEVGGLSLRVGAVETRPMPEPAPVTPIAAGPSVAEVELSLRDRLEPLTKKLDDLTLRVGAVEARPTPEPMSVTPVAAGPSVAEIELSLRDRLEPLTKQLAGLSERVAVIEVKAPTPGPAGVAGTNGLDGKDGKDGADGLGFDDMDVEYDGDRTVLFKFVRGSQTKSWPLVFPFQKYQGVYQQGKAYDMGDTVTWASQLWHCNESTVLAPGDGVKAWQLCVRKGRDGRDGKDFTPQAAPVVSVGGGR
jgi:hypothetical protein